MREKIELFKVLSEPNRVRILMMLLQKPLCVCEITSILELTPATVSNHLSYLRKEGFIDDEKEGKWINYRIIKDSSNTMVRDLINSLPVWFSDEKVVIEDLKKVNYVDRYVICNITIKDS